ncbi:MAG: TonB-dependent receptor [Syntrophales bacterium]|nr:TonB-dependent receptor [Syntrophales bacterium]
MKRLCMTLVFICFTVSHVMADGLYETRMKDIVVTSTRTEKSLEAVPGETRLISKEDFEKRNVITVDSAMNALPGVFVRRTNLMDTLSSVTLRGIPGQSRTLVMKDGIPLNSAYTGDVTLTSMATGDVEKIEVAQGPYSSLYGGYAMGGVVNIITRLPEKRELILRGGYGTSWHRGESLDDLQTYYISYGDKLTNNWKLLVSYGYKATNGYPKDLVTTSVKPPSGYTGWSYISSTQGATNYLIGDKGDNTWWDDSLSVRTAYALSTKANLKLSLMRTRYKYNYDEPHTYIRDANGNPVYSYTSGSSTVRESAYTSGMGMRVINIYDAQLETEIGSVKSKLTVGLNDVEKNWYTLPNTATSPYATLSGENGKLSSSPNQNFLSDLQFSIPLLKMHFLTLGVSYKLGRANTEEHNVKYYKDEDSKKDLTYNSGGKDEVFAVYAQDEIAILENLSVFVGLRGDWWRTYDGYANQFGTGAFAKTYDSRSSSSFSPKLSLVYRPFEKTTLKGSVGKAFRPPTIYELYRTWVGTGTGSSQSSPRVTYKGNPDLQPEKVWAWDMGVKQQLWRGAGFGVTYFENHLKDLIYRKTGDTVQSGGIWVREDVFINAGKAECRGVSLEMEQRIADWLRLVGNFTYQDARIKENIAKPSTVDKRLTYVPDKMFNVTAELERGAFFASVTGRYLSKRYTDDENKDTVNSVPGSYDPFFRWDTKVSYKFNKHIKASITVENVFGEEHYESYRAPGRLWFAELELKF